MLYKHKKTGVIIEAERYHKGLEDGFTETKKPYIIVTANDILDRVLVTANDFIITYTKNNRIYKGLYPRHLFKIDFEFLERG